MTEPTTIRDALEAAIPQDDEALAATLDESAPEPTVEASASDVAEAAAAVEEARSEPAEKPAAKAPRKRASDGKFEKSEGDEASVRQAVEQAESTPAIQPGPKAEPPKEKPPASWRPEIREHWANLPAEVRAEVAKREAEVQRTLQETAEARRFTEQLQNVIRPYEMFIKAENSNPLQAIDNLMATAARLRTGTAPELAQMVAGIVKQFGVGRFGNTFIEQLDSALAGEVPQGSPLQSQVQQALQQQLAPVQQFMSQFQQAQLAAQQQAQQQAVGEVQQFISKAEFGEDVREEMADIMELAQRRGREVSLQDAYRQACLVNPKVRSVLEARSKAKGAAQMTGAAQKAKAAAVSVSGGPALAAPAPTGVNVRSAIEAALASYER